MTSHTNFIGVNQKRSHHQEKVKPTRNSVTDLETNSTTINGTNEKRSNHREMMRRSGSLERDTSETNIGIVNSTNQNRAHQKPNYRPHH